VPGANRFLHLSFERKAITCADRLGTNATQVERTVNSAQHQHQQVAPQLQEKSDPMLLGDDLMGAEATRRIQDELHSRLIQLRKEVALRTGSLPFRVMNNHALEVLFPPKTNQCMN
jgi:hypothetical protein